MSVCEIWKWNPVQDGDSHKRQSSHASCLPKALCFCFSLLPWYVSELSLLMLSSSSLACHLQSILLDLLTYSEQMCVNTVWKKPTQLYHLTIKQCGKCSHCTEKKLVILCYVYPLIDNIRVVLLKLIYGLLKLPLSVVHTEKNFFVRGL